VLDESASTSLAQRRLDQYPLPIVEVRILHCTVCWAYWECRVASDELGQFDILVDDKLISSRGEGLFDLIKVPCFPDTIDIIPR
jgi:hypothetical protein